MMNINNQQYSESGATVLRLGLGTVWIAHALFKLLVLSIPGFATWLGSRGLPIFMAWPVFLLEIIGGTMILLGFYGRYVSVALIPILLVAIWTHAANGWLHTNQGGGWEFPVFLVLASVAHILIGDGRYAMHTPVKHAS